jgi:xanthine/uracil permease
MIARSKPAWWAVVSLVLMVVGAFGPWVKVLGVFTINGTDGGRDGWIVIGAAAVAAVLLLIYARARRKWLLVLPVLAGLVGAATAAYDISDISRLSSGSLFGASDTFSAEWGIYLALAGSLSLTLAALVLMVRRRAAGPETGIAAQVEASS